MMSTPTIKEMVSELIATPSMSSTLNEYDHSNEGVVNLLADWLDGIGLNVSTHAIPDLSGKLNLIATKGEGPDGLILSGHTDTVPFDQDLWQSNPFKIKEQNDRWYGLGTSDMKSFFALIVEAIAPFMNRQFKHPLTILATADEESTMSGIRSLDREHINNARYALIGEPTSLAPITMHKGMMMLRVDLDGHSGHSSNPELGVNALDACANIIQELQHYREYLQQSFKDSRFDVYYPTLNLGCIHGGTNPNRICDHVSISLDLRTLPGMDNHKVLEELQSRLAELPNKEGLQRNLDLIHAPIAPFVNDKTELLDTLTGLTSKAPQSVAFATEAPFLSDLGVETVVLGPGSIDQAHQPNEYIALNQLLPTVAIIRALVEKYCLT
jgi:acetylornithine deacetylase